MSGIFGLYDKSGRVDLAGVERTVRSFRFPGAPPHTIECVRFEHALLGRYHLNIFQHPEIARREGTGSTIITAGYRVGSFPARKGADSPNSGFDRPTLDAIDRYIIEGDAAPFAEFDGAFQIAHCRGAETRLTVVVDRNGLQPLYYYDDNDCLAFAPDFSLLFTILGKRPDVDRESLAEWFEIGMVTGGRTLFANVRVFPAGSLARYEGKRLTFHRYWHPVYAEKGRDFDVRAALNLFDGALRESVRERAGLAPNISVLLSGGMDSRLLLATAAGEGLSLRACTFGPERSPDHRIAAEVAERLHAEHRQFVDRPASMATFFEAGMRKTGGMGNPVDFTGISHLPDIARSSPIVFNGYGGNNLLGNLAFDLLRFLVPRDRGYLSRWLSGKLNPGWRPDELAHIRHALAPRAPEFSVRIMDFWKTHQGHSLIALLYQFLTEEKARHIDLVGVMADTVHLEPVAPFYANNVVDLALSIPPGERMLARFYRRFLRTKYPAAAGIEYSRSGLPANASTMRIMAKKLRHRFAGREAGDPWVAWFRGELHEYVGDHLLSGQPRISELLGGDFVKSTIEDFRRGPNPRGRIVGQMLGCELFLRIFAGKSGK